MGFWKNEWKALAWGVAGFLAIYFAPLGPRVAGALSEAVALAQWYAREHMLLCLVPAFFIAGAIAVFVRQGAVIRYLGAGASRVTAGPVGPPPRPGAAPSARAPAHPAARSARRRPRR